MYDLDLNGHDGEYELRELIKMWPPDRIADLKIKIPDAITDRNAAKRYVFDLLYKVSGYRPEWGILTGVRPVKLVNEFFSAGKKYDEIRKILDDVYYIDENKISLLMETSSNQRVVTQMPVVDNKVGVYIGIPFCPTRCIYCSFTSNQVETPEMEKYVQALLSELDYVGNAMNARNMRAESIYLGGGTPTSLPPHLLNKLMDKVTDVFDFSEIREFCVEAGRPDTITDDKLDILAAHNVQRISINPQSMNQKTLELIGRRHTVNDIRNAFETAHGYGFKQINSDIIAGLPNEDISDFLYTLKEVIALHATNITVHTLAVKRASKLIELNQNYHYEHASDVANMVNTARSILAESGYKPYYLYRQKHMTGNLENVGYSKKDCESVYNVRIMDEHQTIVALGAGGISKAYYPETNRLERIPNVSNYSVYIDRIEEMIQRKKDKLFK